MEAVVVSFGVIFVAELGDKSQLMALAFAARYRALPVLIGISIATAATHAISVALGAAIGARFSTSAVNVLAGLAFLGFAVWTLRGDQLDDGEAAKVDRSTRYAVVAASVAFFLAELGDKTMLATITLATTHGVFGTWLGSTLGMIAADAMAIAVGQQLGTRLPERTVRIAASVLFVMFGLILLIEGIAG
jgi:putative Ca2+/H+ antiporter (TMEM165/GDT1 family)